MDLLAAAGRMWQYLTAPRFVVQISSVDYDEKIVVTAGEKTKVCTISVSLDYNGQLDRSKYVRPLFDYNQCENVHVTCENERWDNGTVVLDMFVHVTEVGSYSIFPKFPTDISYIRFTADKPSFPLQVKPSNICSILLKDYVNSKPTKDDRQCGAQYTSYRGDTVKIYVDVVDEFGNKYSDDLSLHIVCSGQSLMVVYPATRDECSGWYVVSGRYQEVGTTIVQFSLRDDTHLNAQALSQEVKVIPPPVSPDKCYIIKSDIDKIQKRIHEAGQPITFKLKLIDVFGNAIRYEESTKFFVKNIRVVSHDTTPEVDQDSSEEISRFTTWEKNSFKTNLSGIDSSACELSFTPYRAGKRLLVLHLREEDEEVEKPPLRFDVNPGPLAEFQISHEPPATNQNFLSSYLRQLRIVVVRGKDAFGNKLVMDPSKWYLDTLGDLKQETNLKEREENALVFHYSFDKPGKYEVDITPKQSMSRLTKFPSFKVEVVRAPLGFEKCVCECADEMPIFVGEPRSSFRIRVSIRDCIGYTYSLTAADSDFRIEMLSLKVDGEACNVIAIDSGTEDGEIYLTTVLDNEKVGTKFVQVLYDDKPLGEKVAMKIVGLKTYEPNDFVRPNKKVICCINIRQGMLEELADEINLDNINRVVLEGEGEVALESTHIKENTGNGQVKLIDVDLKNFETKTLPKVEEVISLWVKGIHYRNQANEFDRERVKWKAKSMDAYSSKKHEEAKANSVIKKRFASLMNQCHRRASDAIFDFYNKNRPQSELDLHGQLVADPKAMGEYKQLLVSKREKSAAEVGSMMERERQERDEAIRKLEERLINFDHEKAKQDGEDWLEIIDGAGHHSAMKGEQKIRPKVKEYLNTQKLKYVEANRGALLITFSEYTGREPCVANFYCTRCKKSWISTASWNGFYQKCHRCDSRGADSECHPFKLRSATPQRRRRRRSANSDFIGEDHVSLCQKCEQLGRDCRRQ